ncbi:flavodoxin [Clostridium gasigenes]|uniref:Flavodoxin n=1 Tax=Clostridium gasigenes TaxID=94869 RepID=A0A1H0VYU5_9CLOT|nr:flavodoxin [Clostridium gasigenes]MBU3090210.1 flavodoxin [Clostridium gasigenes]MBU3107467.1 flavodoxin [Clostridium gasigenes]SDP83463.1 flavodoxin, short chain [Clostridium gasigenes]
MKIIYWSGTGNTEDIANLIAKGIEEGGKEAELINISNNSVDNIEEEVVVLGCAAMGNEELEESEFVPALEKLQDNLKNKKVALFGSYGWGDGEWMRIWEESMTSMGIQVLLEPLIINYAPEGDAIKECIDYGSQIAKLYT